MERTINDSLASLFGGLGDINRDKAAGVYYGTPMLSPLHLMNAYRGSWLPRKIVNIPAEDAIRKWRDWQADAKDITTIEGIENTLGLRGKLGTAMKRARLFGGAAIFIGTDQNPAMPLNVERIGKDGLRFLTVLSKHQLTPGPLDVNVTSEWYEQPQYFQIANTQQTIHPSHLVILHGEPMIEPQMGMPGVMGYGWGDSVLLSMFKAITDMDSSMANIASMIFEANVDVFGIPQLLESLTDPQYEAKLINRFGLVAVNKGINRSILRDAAETYDRKQISFTGLDAIVEKFFQFVSGASDIPATRLLGMSPAGMSSTGESDLRNYYDSVSTMQNVDLTPAARNLDEAIIRSAFGSRPDEIFYNWSPLWQITDKERSEIGKTTAETANILLGTSLIPSEALSKALINSLTESGVYPGLEQLVNEAGPIDFEAQEREQAEREAAALEAMAANQNGEPSRQAANDMAPTPLYVSRQVVNVTDIERWAASQGITINVDRLHVTVCYSRAPIDWMEIGEPWSSKLIIGEGGPRIVERFDNAGVVVLSFASNDLKWRHRHIMELGGSHDFGEYQPHITLVKEMPGVASLDLATVKPYTGEIHLGPEIFVDPL